MNSLWGTKLVTWTQLFRCIFKNSLFYSDKSARKPKQKLTDQFSDSTKPVNKQQKQTDPQHATQKWTLEQLDGAKINSDALKELNDMLKVPKPREVKIL